MSEILVFDEAIAFRVALQDAIDQASSRVILLESTLIELIGALAAACSRSTPARLTFAVIGGATARSTEKASFLSFNSSSNLVDLRCVLTKVDAIKGDQSWKPDLESRTELIILLRLPGEHRIHWVLDHVQMLDLREVGANDRKCLIHISYRVVSD